MARERTGAWSASGQAELENRIVLLRVELEIYAGGGGRELATSDLKVKLGFDCLCEDRGTFGRRQASGRQAARLLQSFMHGRKRGRQAAGSQVAGGQTDRRQIDRRQVCWRQATWK